MATRDYTLGKGKVLFKPEGEDGYIDLGNAPAFAINVNIEKLEHFSSREGLSLKDLEVITRLGMGGSFTLDEPNGTNLSMFVMSDAGATSAAQNAGTTAPATINTIVLDRWYPLTLAGTGTAAVDTTSYTAETSNTGTETISTITGTAAAITADSTVKLLVSAAGTNGTVKVSVNGSDWSTGLTLTAGVVVIGTAGDATEDLLEGLTLTFSNAGVDLDVYDQFGFDIKVSGATRVTNLTALTVSGSVINVDFSVDMKAGLFMALSAGNIAAASNVAFNTAAYNANATRTQTTGGTLTSLKGDIYFVGDPPQGRVIDVLGYCSLTPNGDLGLIGTDWMQVQFNVEFLQLEGQTGLVTLNDRGKIG